MKPRGPIVDAAIARFGEPNWRLTSLEELRFGNQGSVSVTVNDGLWYDFESGKGGRLSVQQLTPPMRTIVTERYDYRNLSGELLYQVSRTAPKGQFLARVPAGDGWHGSKGCTKGLPIVPYRLPEIAQLDEVVIVEGEKDANNLAAIGIQATTAPGFAANRWDEMAQFFAGKSVLVLVDNDEKGQRRGQDTVRGLLPVAAAVRLAPPFQELGDKADVSDFLEAGGDVYQLLAKVRKQKPETVVAENVFPTIDANDIQAVITTNDFVEGVLIEGQMSVLYGPSNSGKTFFATDLAMHVAIGRPWRNLDVTATSVLYVAAEGAMGVKNRVAAFCQHHQIDDMPLTIVVSQVNMFNSTDDVETLMATIRQASHRIGNVGLIIVDTLARVMAGGNENDASDMGLLVSHVDKLCQELGVHVMLDHHSGKDTSKGARGSSALRAATATEIEVEPRSSGSVAKVTKQRDLEIAGTFGFRLLPVRLGTNARGRPVTSCVVEPVDLGTRQRPKKPRGSAQKLCLKGLVEAMATSGTSRRVWEHDIICVTMEQWRAAAFKVLVGESKHKSTNFTRAVTGLVADEFVIRDPEQDLVWPG